MLRARRTHRIRRAHPTIVAKDYFFGKTLIWDRSPNNKPYHPEFVKMAKAPLAARRRRRSGLLRLALFRDRFLDFLLADGLQLLVLRRAKNLLQLWRAFVVDGPQLLHLLDPGE